MEFPDFPVEESGYHIYPRGPLGWNEPLTADFRKTAEEFKKVNEQLDNKVEKETLLVWREVIYGSDFGPDPNRATTTVRYAKDTAGIVYVKGICTKPTAFEAFAILFTLPVGFRPKYDYAISISGYQNTFNTIILVMSDGHFMVGNPPPSGYPLNGFIPIDTVFMAEN